MVSRQNRADHANERSTTQRLGKSTKPFLYSLSNGCGDIVAQSDESAAITWTASYEAFGQRPAETGTNLDKQRANSKDEDPTGLLNEGFRYRDLETGTFISRDPAGFVDGPNLYAYVQQNPWTKFDPLGLSAVGKAKKIIEETTAKIKRVVKNKPINSRYGEMGMKPLSDFTEEQLAQIRKLDPNFEGQKWKPTGYPDFSKYALKINGSADFSLNDFAKSIGREPMKGNDNMKYDTDLLIRFMMASGVEDKAISALLKTHTLHHVEGGELAQLVPSVIHAASRHSGGSADIRALAKSSGAAVATFAGSILIPHSMEASEKGEGRVQAAIKDFGSMADPGFLEPVADAERYARDHDIMGSFENLLMYGTFTEPKPLNISR